MDKFMAILAYDGDGCGKKVGRAIMANDEKGLGEISAKIDLGHEIVNHWVADHGGSRISGGGDEGTFQVPHEALDAVEGLRKDHEYATGITISIGIGENLSEAGRALLAAKFRGKNQIAHYGKDVEKDIFKARKKVKKGRASQEEYKLAEAYLEKAEGGNMDNQGCPYCEATDQIDPTHCKYCHDNAAAADEVQCPFCIQEDVATDCPFCTENPTDAEACPFCTATPDQDIKIQSPDSNNAQPPPGSPQETADYAEMGMSPPGIPKPQVGDGMAPTGMGQANPIDESGAGQGAPIEPQNADPAEIQANDGIAPDASAIPLEGAHSKEDLEAIAAQIAAETVDGRPDDKQLAENIDDTAIVGNDMEGNVSRPAGFGENTPGDMGLDTEHAEEGNPDLSSVLREGLDDQSGEIQKEKVRNIVGQALQGFKANKQVLEAAKLQSPGFYQSSISMLLAMIQMAEMLGLGGVAQGEATINDPNSAMLGEEQVMGDSSQQNEWHDPFPLHPDRGGEQKPGHAAPQGVAAQAPKGDAPIGQPIGKLPSKATKHVARTPLPPGAINAKGQQKVMDPKTGEVRFIDRKQGMVQSATGIPVKPPGRGTNEPKN